MAFVKCDQGHLYNTDQNATCPYCQNGGVVIKNFAPSSSESENKKDAMPEQPAPAPVQDEDKTVPIYFGKGSAEPAGNAPQPVDIGKTVPASNMAQPVDIGKTMPASNMAQPVDIGKTMPASNMAQPVDIGKTVPASNMAQPLDIGKTMPASNMAQPADIGKTMPATNVNSAEVRRQNAMANQAAMQPAAQPMQNNMAQPMQNNMAQPMQNNMAQPMQNNMAQPMQNNMAQPMQNNMAQPMQNNMAQPMQNNMAQPMQNNGMPQLAPGQMMNNGMMQGQNPYGMGQPQGQKKNIFQKLGEKLKQPDQPVMNQMNMGYSMPQNGMQPAQNNAVQPMQQPIVQPMGNPISQNSIQPMQQPVVQPMGSPISQNSTQPMQQPAVQPMGNPMPQNNLQPVPPMPAAQPAMEAQEDIGKTVGVMQKNSNATVEPVVGWLVCIEGAEKGKDYRIYEKINTVGRGGHMDISIQGDTAISRENYAKINYDSKHNVCYLVPGENSSNIYLHGEAVIQPEKLQPFDKLEFGSTHLVYVPFCNDRFNWKDGITVAGDAASTTEEA